MQGRREEPTGVEKGRLAVLCSVVRLFAATLLLALARRRLSKRKEGPPPLLLAVFGPAGCGKSSVAAALAKRLGLPMIEADDHHDDAARKKMADGFALNDDDRAPWLIRVRDAVASASAKAGGAVLACSALKSKYRRVLASSELTSDMAFVYLKTSADTLRARVEERQKVTGHFFPPQLVTSQLETLEIDDNVAAYNTERGAGGAKALVEHIVADVLALQSASSWSAPAFYAKVNHAVRMA